MPLIGTYTDVPSVHGSANKKPDTRSSRAWAMANPRCRVKCALKPINQSIGDRTIRMRRPALRFLGVVACVAAAMARTAFKSPPSYPTRVGNTVPAAAADVWCPADAAISTPCWRNTACAGCLPVKRLALLTRGSRRGGAGRQLHSTHTARRPRYHMPEPLHSGACAGRFAVVTLWQPRRGVQQCQIFGAISAVTAGGLRDLGYDVVELCCALGAASCTVPEYGTPQAHWRTVPWRLDGRQAVLLGLPSLFDEDLPAHHPRAHADALPQALRDNATREVPARKVPLPALVATGWLPADAVAYQWEHISPGLVSGYNFVLWGDYIGTLRHWRVWDFSYSNAVVLARDHGVRACLAPVGYHPVLLRAAPPHRHPHPHSGPHLVTPAAQNIDVLFFGSVHANSARGQQLQRLTDAGVHVTVVPQHEPRFQRQLAAMTVRSKVVLVLSAFADPGEFKVSRLMELWAVGAFALMEDTAVAQDVAPFLSGVALTTPASLVDDVQYWLAHPHRRAAVAAAGHAAFRRRSAAAALHPCVEELLLTSGCA